MSIAASTGVAQIRLQRLNKIRHLNYYFIKARVILDSIGCNQYGNNHIITRGARDAPVSAPIRANVPKCRN